VRFVVCLAICTALIACAPGESSAPDGLFFPTVPRQEMYPAALFQGRLVQRSGCILGSAGGKAGVILLWPDGYQVGGGPDGRTHVLDENGTTVGTVGEIVSLGGGSVGASFDTEVYRQTPSRCGHHYWLVAPSTP
jgi:hypothetical protein